MNTVRVVHFAEPMTQELLVTTWDQAELHMSTNGVLVVRSENGRKVLATFNNNAWFQAEVTDQ